MLLKKKKTKDWCSECGIIDHFIHGFPSKRKKIRCPKCGRRVLMKSSFTEDGLPDFAIPKHKTKLK